MTLPNNVSIALFNALASALAFIKCNRNDYKDNHAIGMLDYRNVEKRRKLDNAMAYLVKEDQSIDALKGNEKDRSIRRGTMPKEKSKKGRPRNQ